MTSAPQIGAESTANEPVATRAVGRAPRMTPIPSTHGSPVIGASQSQTSTTVERILEKDETDLKIIKQLSKVEQLCI